MSSKRVTDTHCVSDTNSTSHKKSKMSSLTVVDGDKSNNGEHPAVSNFRQYLRIKTVEPEPQYEEAVDFLITQAKSIGLPYKKVMLSSGFPLLYMTWEGLQPSLPSLVLNSHMDVVPIYPEFWCCDAWSGIKMENGDIYGRGTQDMKSCGMQHIEAIRVLKAEGQRFQRTIHLLFVPDEECAGFKGMKLFIETDDFKKMNPGFVLDEGLANPSNDFTVFYGERGPWWVKIKCPGNPGHASRFIQDTAAEKVRKIINRFLDYRAEEEKKMHGNCLELGEVVTVNMTKMEGGVAYNVVPAEFCVAFDIRLPPSIDLKKFEARLDGMIKECGEDLTYEFLQKTMIQDTTSTSADDSWWRAFSAGCSEAGVKFKTSIFPAATDSRFLRALGIPAIGFSPMNNTPILLHDHNERLNERVFLNGITIFTKIIPKLANMATSGE